MNSNEFEYMIFRIMIYIVITAVVYAAMGGFDGVVDAFVNLTRK